MNPTLNYKTYQRIMTSRVLKFLDGLCHADFAIKAQNRRYGFHDQEYVFNSDEVAFVHLPKTGGSSLHQVLKEIKVTQFVNIDMHRPVSEKCPPEQYAYITVMRNPVDRVWSYYQMVLRSPDDFPYKPFAEKGLDYFIRHCWEARNMACRYYSGRVKREPTLQTMKAGFRNLMQFAEVLSFEDLEREAKAFLARYGQNMGPFPHKRKISYEKPDQASRERILEMNRLDMELFNLWQENTRQNIS